MKKICKDVTGIKTLVVQKTKNNNCAHIVISLQHLALGQTAAGDNQKLQELVLHSPIILFLHEKIIKKISMHMPSKCKKKHLCTYQRRDDNSRQTII